MRKLLKLPDDVRAELTRHYQKKQRRWLTDQSEFPLTIKLGLPTEEILLTQSDVVYRWISEWQACTLAGEIIWEERRLRNLGVQRLPSQLILKNTDEVTTWAATLLEWKKIQKRYRFFVDRWPTLSSPLQRHLDMLISYSDNDIESLWAVLNWIILHPASGYYIRQLPIAGIDSKWLEQRKSLINELIAILQNTTDISLNFFQRCGLRSVARTVRLRILDKKIRSQFGGLEDITTPIQQLAQSDLSAKHAFIVENLQTGLAFSDIPDTIVFMQLGYGVDVFADMPWLQQANCIYWGDIDTHGFAILNRARSYLPQLHSMLMDINTLNKHKDLWVTETRQHHAAFLPLLNETEQSIYTSLKQQHYGTNIRLEQERIEWEYAWDEIQKIASNPAA